MTGPEHYREAERCIARSAEATVAERLDITNSILMLAQVHATLALAAATALQGCNGSEATDYADWLNVTADTS